MHQKFRKAVNRNQLRIVEAKKRKDVGPNILAAVLRTKLVPVPM